MSHVLQIFSVLIAFLFKADFLKQMFTFYIVNYFFPLWLLAFPGGPEVKASAWNAGDVGSIPGSGRSPGEGNGNPLQYSCLGNSTDRGAWRATVHGVAKSQTRLE